MIMDRPIAVAFSILEFSKLHMYKFHDFFTEILYNPDQCELLFTDTDSLMYKVRCEDIYKDLKSICQSWLDTSNYPSYHSL